MPASTVKRARPYDSSARRRAAGERRELLLDSASVRFATAGYAGTTVAAVAADAGVSPETVYKAFGGKRGLVRALWSRALAGEGPVSAEARSDAVSGGSEDPHVVIAAWARLAEEVSPHVSGLALLLREAAATDPAAAGLRDELDDQRLERMTHNAKAIRRHLRPGLTVEQARDVLFAMSSPELYEILVVRQRWSVAAYADFVRRGIIAELLGE